MKRFKQLLKLRSHKRFRLGLFIIAMALALVLFEEVHDDVFYDPLEGDLEAQQFDQLVARTLKGYHSPLLTDMMRDLTALGSMSVMISFMLILFAVLLIYKSYKGLLYLTIIFLGAGAIPYFLKIYFNRPRPDQAQWLTQVSQLSYPSGHSFAAGAIYLGLAFYVTKFTRTWKQEVFFYFLAFLIVAIIGLSRIYLGVHYASDVFAGISLGAFWAFLISAIYEWKWPVQRL